MRSSSAAAESVPAREDVAGESHKEGEGMEGKGGASEELNSGSNETIAMRGNTVVPLEPGHAETTAQSI
eukprot:scaffold6800_cov105-Pinguiococcus_pyrenoidosus.AAC.1